MSKVYVILEGGGYYGGDYDEMNSDEERFICVYANEETAKAHLKKWEEDKRKQPWYQSHDRKWTHEEKEVCVKDMDDDSIYGSWNYCMYQEVDVLQEVRLE